MSVEWWALGISIVALLGTLTKDFFIPIFFKPTLKIEGIDDGECIQDASDNLNNITRWIRLRLINKDGFFSRTAKDCYVKLLWVKNSNGTKITPFESLPLTWVSYDDFSGGKYDLARGEYHMIDLVHEFPQRRFLRFKLAGIPLELIKESESKLSPGIYSFGIAVYGGNFKPIRKIFKARITNKFGELNFVK
ncbi:MAG: hypothetical protein AABW51_02640 [Nanoarchaeota archaeon]